MTPAPKTIRRHKRRRLEIPHDSLVMAYIDHYCKPVLDIDISHYDSDQSHFTPHVSVSHYDCGRNRFTLHRFLFSDGTPLDSPWIEADHNSWSWLLHKFSTQSHLGQVSDELIKKLEIYLREQADITFELYSMKYLREQRLAKLQALFGEEFTLNWKKKKKKLSTVRSNYPSSINPLVKVKSPRGLSEIFYSDRINYFSREQFWKIRWLSGITVPHNLALLRLAPVRLAPVRLASSRLASSCSLRILRS